MVTEKEKEEYSDWISYIDDDNQKIENYVKILSITPLVTFETINKTRISLPYHKVNKIKQKNGATYG